METVIRVRLRLPVGKSMTKKEVSSTILLMMVPKFPTEWLPLKAVLLLWDGFRTMLWATGITVLHNSMYNHSLWMKRSEEHTSELQSRPHLVCRLLLEKKKYHI